MLAAGLPLASALRGVDAAPALIVLLVGLVGALVQAFALRAFFAAVWADVSALILKLIPARFSVRSPAISSNPG